MKNILISGGSGFVGSQLVAFLQGRGFQVKILSRSGEGDNVIRWNPAEEELPSSVMKEADAVINLAGAGIASRKWTEERKRVLRSSRIDSTRTLVNAMRKSSIKPSVFISISGINYYAPGSSLKTEQDPAGDTFLSRLCVEWESEASKATEQDIRTTILRLGVVLDKTGGALKKMLPPFRLGMGGPIGNGSQGFPWISMRDLLNIIAFVVEEKSAAGPINVVHPDRVDQRGFAKALGKALRRPAVVPLPAIAVRLLFGQMGEEMLLADMNVVPQQLSSHQYPFQEESLEDCLLDLFSAQ